MKAWHVVHRNILPLPELSEWTLPRCILHLVQAPVGSSATGAGHYWLMVLLMAIAVGNKKKSSKRAEVGAFG